MNFRPILPLLLSTTLLLSPVYGGSALEWWTDYGARELLPESTRPAGAGQSLTLLAPVNGVASGQIAVRETEPITKLEATVSALTGKNGTLPDGAVRVRFLTNKNLMEPGTESAGPLATIGETFLPGPSPLGIVYLTAKIPNGSLPGDYSGKVAIRTDKGTVEVPLMVRVADFVMPDPKDLDLWISLMQSPAQLAYFYKTKPYDDAHWKVIEASTRLLGEIGNHVLFVPVLWHANVGSGPQMIVFRKEGDTLKPDFSRLERYFKMVGELCGPQRLLVLGVWGTWLSNPGAEGTPAPTLFLTEESGDGELKPLEWSADYAAHRDLWKSVFDGVAALAEKYLGLPQNRIVLGFGDDRHPSEEVDKIWREIAPQSLGWDAWTHNYGAKGPRPAFFQIVDTEPPTDVKELLAWPPRMEPLINDDGSSEPIYISSCRDIQNGRSPAVVYYSLPDLAATPQKTGHSVGFSRMGLDFWRKSIPLVDGTVGEGDGFARDASDRRAHPGRVVRNYRGYFTSPGPEGAVPLIHLDALREGVQAAQARITVARAVGADPGLEAEMLPVLQLQMEKGARHSVLQSARGETLTEIPMSLLQDGWEPIFKAGGKAQRALAGGEKKKDPKPTSSDPK